MKRRRLPQQSTPLQRKKRMPRSGKPLKRGPVKPRRPMVSAEEHLARKLVKARSGGVCEIYMCGGAIANDWSHRVRQGQGGPWEAVNGLAACRRCHTDITLYETKTRAVQNGWVVRSWNDPARVPVLRRGEWVLLHEDGTYTPTHQQGAA